MGTGSPGDRGRGPAVPGVSGPGTAGDVVTYAARPVTAPAGGAETDHSQVAQVVDKDGKSA
ncbi:hypothetical protein GCM10010517_20990 [Streptosporangium fragile]|uniref:Uncharacterized protein n=1 Tax=Streptosporangium fragile TaxID=46186 RepID=A0ABN3VVW1_9ACTN